MAQSTATPVGSPEFKLVVDSTPQINLVLSGWSRGLALGTTIRPARRTRKGIPGATVEVWDYALPDPAGETFRLFRIELYKNISQAMLSLPPSNHEIDFSILSGYLASHPNAVGVDRLIVESLQDRFNSRPANTITSSGAPPFFFHR